MNSTIQRSSEVKIIGAGLPRTATLTQKIALETLGYGPCFHMANIVADMSLVPEWAKALDGRADWNKIFAGYGSTVDYPGAYFYQELMAVFPDAKVLLSVRDGESWARSMHDTIWGSLWGDTLMHDLTMAQARIDPARARYGDLMRALYTKSGLFGDDPARFEVAASAAAMERYNAEVRDVVPAERLLVWSPVDDWAPLCEFLGKPVPEAPLPHSNGAQAFTERVIGGCMAALNKWHAQALSS